MYQNPRKSRPKKPDFFFVLRSKKFPLQNPRKSDLPNPRKSQHTKLTFVEFEIKFVIVKFV